MCDHSRNDSVEELRPHSRAVEQARTSPLALHPGQCPLQLELPDDLLHLERLAELLFDEVVPFVLLCPDRAPGLVETNARRLGRVEHLGLESEPLFEDASSPRRHCVLMAKLCRLFQGSLQFGVDRK